MDHLSFLMPDFYKVCIDRIHAARGSNCAQVSSHSQLMTGDEIIITISGKKKVRTSQEISNRKAKDNYIIISHSYNLESGPRGPTQS